MSSVRALTNVPGTAWFRLRTDLARLTSGPYCAIRLDVSGLPCWVVTTMSEAAEGFIVDDGRPRYASLDRAFRAADREAVLARARVREAA